MTHDRTIAEIGAEIGAKTSAPSDGAGKSGDALPRRWLGFLWRLFGQIMEDRTTLVAAGVSFYMLLALFPGLAAFVAVYGLVADPDTISGQVSLLSGLLPQGVLDLISAQLENLAAQGRQVQSLRFVIAVLVAFWSANSGVKALFEALNIAYEEREKRSFIRLNLTAFTLTLGAMLISFALVGLVGVVPAVLAFFHLGQFSETIIRVGRWPVILLLISTGISVLYRFGPSRGKGKGRWITWGGMLATLVWVAAAAGFSWYLENFANYEITYGSLATVAGFMLWIWISAVILIVGAELNDAIEREKSGQTRSPG